MLAAKFGEVTGISPAGTVDALEKAITDFTAAYAGKLGVMDEEMFSLAEEWQSMKSFDFIGDDIQYCTAFFDAAKIVEVAGGMVSIDDSEDWCHVGFFQKDPAHIGTVIVADKLAKDRSRIRETVKQAAGIGRPVLLVANGTKEDFGITEEIRVCSLPEAPAGYEFLLPLLDYLPGALFASYLSALWKESYFRGGGRWNEANTIKGSKIEVM